ncbi:MAG: hypothetical protein GY749_12255 [Desulfobacteraceae bacterium]|nr:hypothetical protein [Desulfobacteraceae bacterium]
MNIRKIKQFGIITFCTVIFCFHMAHNTQAASLEISKTASAGNVVTYTVSVNSAPNKVLSFGFDLNYDSSVLRYKKHEKGSLVPSDFIFLVNEPSQGIVRVGGTSVGKNTNIQQGQSGILVVLTFEAVANNGNGKITFASIKDDIKSWSVKDSVSVPGDINSDKTSDLSDAILSLKLLSGIVINDIYADADVDYDKKIGLEETVYILQKISDIRKF